MAVETKDVTPSWSTLPTVRQVHESASENEDAARLDRE